MSGHGVGEATSERYRVSAEVRTVNHRFCRVSMRLPAEIGFFEDTARRMIQSRVQRGKVDLSLTVQSVTGTAARVDHGVAAAWMKELTGLAEELGAEPPSLPDVLALPGVVLSNGMEQVDPDVIAPTLGEALGAALDGLQSMRSREGEHLAGDLVARVQTVAGGLESIRQASRELPARTRDQLRQRIEDLLAETGREIDPDRLLQEAAYHAERADITEEIVRLGSHLEKMRGLLQSSDAVGRTLEFLSQEIHRELSTIGAKTKELDIAELVVDLKSELERIREQVQNIE